MDSKLPVFCGDVPEYKIRGDYMLVKYADLELAIPIDVCIKSVGRCQRELDRWHEAKGRVLPFRKRVEH